MLAAIISFFAGLILQTICQKNRQDFEMELYRVTHDEKQLMSEKVHKVEFAQSNI